VFISHSGAAAAAAAADDHTSLLACDAVWLGKWFLMFQTNTLPSSSEEQSTLT